MTENTEMTTAEIMQAEYEKVMRMIDHDIAEAKQNVKDLKAKREASEKAWKYAMGVLAK